VLSARSPIAAMGLVALFAAACAKPSYPACRADDECAHTGEQCADRRCVECATDALCEHKLGHGARCLQNRCRTTIECMAESDCAADQSCEAHRCVPTAAAELFFCRTNDECADGERCERGHCIAPVQVASATPPQRHVTHAALPDPTPAPAKMTTLRDETPALVAKERPAAKTTGAAASPPSGLPQECPVFPSAAAFRLLLSGFQSGTTYGPDLAHFGTVHAPCLRALEGFVVRVIGHCDDRGEMEMNDKLSIRRAEEVLRALAAAGVPEDRMTAEGRGERELRCTDPSARCAAKNRRVEVRLERTTP
jgi:peptidoglycan-associated lipoprotein